MYSAGDISRASQVNGGSSNIQTNGDQARNSQLVPVRQAPAIPTPDLSSGSVLSTVVSCHQGEGFSLWDPARSPLPNNFLAIFRNGSASDNTDNNVKVQTAARFFLNQEHPTEAVFMAMGSQQRLGSAYAELEAARFSLRRQLAMFYISRSDLRRRNNYQGSLGESGRRAYQEVQQAQNNLIALLEVEAELVQDRQRPDQIRIVPLIEGEMSVLRNLQADAGIDGAWDALERAETCPQRTVAREILVALLVLERDAARGEFRLALEDWNRMFGENQVKIAAQQRFEQAEARLDRINEMCNRYLNLIRETCEMARREVGEGGESKRVMLGRVPRCNRSAENGHAGNNQSRMVAARVGPNGELVAVAEPRMPSWTEMFAGARERFTGAYNSWGRITSSIDRLAPSAKMMVAGSATHFIMDEMVGGQNAHPLARQGVGLVNSMMLAGASYVGELTGVSARGLLDATVLGYGQHLANIGVLSIAFIPNSLVNQEVVNVVEDAGGFQFSHLERAIVGTSLALGAVIFAEHFATAIVLALGTEVAVKIGIGAGVTISLPVGVQAGVLAISGVLALLVGAYHLLQDIGNFLDENPEFFLSLEGRG
ncbi:MAG: hypothetical protein ABH859_01570 [Pseudomonadota bacterium]